MSIEVQQNISYRPFLKWAGGKGKLIQKYENYFPPRFKNYYEPFLGGGAIFFNLFQTRPPFKAILTDINAELINAYHCVRNNVNELIELLEEHQCKHNKYYYYDLRECNNLEGLEAAARLIYLNRTCFNGLYRVNKQGKFNVPIGKYNNPQICQVDILHAASKALQSAEIHTRNFQEVLNYAESKDFVYFDPPYYPLNSTSNFTAYNQGSFTESDHKTLKEVFVQLANREVYVMLSNSACEVVENLYKDQGFKIHKILASRTINSNTQKRGKVHEFLITSYSRDAY